MVCEADVGRDEGLEEAFGVVSAFVERGCAAQEWLDNPRVVERPDVESSKTLVGGLSLGWTVGCGVDD